jgi:hypothetical protein
MFVLVDGLFVSINNRFLHRADSKEILKYKLDLVGVQEVRGEGSGTETAGEYTFFCETVNENHELGTGFCV